MKPFKPNERQKRLIREANRRAEDAALQGRHAPDDLVARMSEELADVFAVPPPQLRPTIFLDIDDVLSLNVWFGGLDVQLAAAHPGRAPKDLYEKVFSRVAVHALNELISEFNPRVVITSSWLALIQREHFIDLFKKTGVSICEMSLHPHWDAQQNYGTSRLDAIETWLMLHHEGEPILILDDSSSGESLVDSLWHEAGHVVLCEVDIGFNAGLLDAARTALRKSFNLRKPWLP